MWKGTASGTPSTYDMYDECPISQGTATTSSGGGLAAMQKAIQQFIYGSKKALPGTVTFQSVGTVTVTGVTVRDVAAGNLIYAVTKVGAELAGRAAPPRCSCLAACTYALLDQMPA